jgi:hypothetical protein
MRRLRVIVITMGVGVVQLLTDATAQGYFRTK